MAKAFFLEEALLWTGHRAHPVTGEVYKGQEQPTSCSRLLSCCLDRSPVQAWAGLAGRRRHV